jgi:RNA polymerase sigma-70 factor (ECF subfamily)
VRRLSRDDEAAREIVQDVWLRVIRGIPRLRDASKLRAWLFGIARNVLMDRLRDQYARPPAVVVDADELAAEPPGDKLDNEPFRGSAVV